MIKLTYCVRRKSGMSVEDFRAYWRDIHGPLVVKYKDVLGIKRYVQCRALNSQFDIPLRAARVGSIGAAPETYDGIAEIWFESFEALLAASKTPEAMKAGRELLKDEARFIDLANSPLWYGEEVEMI